MMKYIKTLLVIAALVSVAGCSTLELPRKRAFGYHATIYMDEDVGWTVAPGSSAAEQR